MSFFGQMLSPRADAVVYPIHGQHPPPAFLVHCRVRVAGYDAREHDAKNRYAFGKQEEPQAGKPRTAHTGDRPMNVPPVPAV